jgi:hypothetical protein
MKTSKVLFVLFAVLGAVPAFAQPYAPGETLDPACLPSDINCTITFAENGLTQTVGNRIQLGGQLIRDTEIDINGNEFSIVNGDPLASLGQIGLQVGATKTFESIAEFGGNILSPNYFGILQESIDGLRNKQVYNGLVYSPISGYIPMLSVYDSDNGGVKSFSSIQTMPNQLLLQHGKEGQYNVQQNISSSYSLEVLDDVLGSTDGLAVMPGDGVRITSELGQYYFPRTDGTANQVLATDGAGQLSWQTPAGGGSGWSLTGNAGTDGGLTNFIGTTDAQDFTIRTNSNSIARFGQDSNVALGNSTQAIGVNSFAINEGSVANAFNSFAGGEFAQANGDTSFAFGSATFANGTNSVAFNAIADGIDSFAIQNGNSVGDSSIALGNVSALSGFETVMGMLNTLYVPQSSTTFDLLDRLFVVGNGSNPGSESDALTILKNGQIGIGIDNFEANTNGSIFQVGDGLTNVIGYVDNGTGNWVAVSDERKKDNIQDLTYGLDTLLKLSPKSYTMKSTGDRSIGFLAQETQTIVPESVFGDDEKGYGMSYSTLVPITVRAIQELNTKVDLLSLAQGTKTRTLSESITNMVKKAISSLSEIATETIRATTGIFEKVSAKKIETDTIQTNTLCVGQTCITESELQEFLEYRAGQFENNTSEIVVVQDNPSVIIDDKKQPELPSKDIDIQTQESDLNSKTLDTVEVKELPQE